MYPAADGDARAEQRLKDLHITLPAPPTPFGAYAEAVQTGNLLFVSGMLPTAGGAPAVVGRVGADLDVETAARAARLAALNALAVARAPLKSLDRLTRVVRHASRSRHQEIREQPRIADGASMLPQGGVRCIEESRRLVHGVASLPPASRWRWN